MIRFWIDPVWSHEFQLDSFKQASLTLLKKLQCIGMEVLGRWVGKFYQIFDYTQIGVPKSKFDSFKYGPIRLCWKNQTNIRIKFFCFAVRKFNHISDSIQSVPRIRLFPSQMGQTDSGKRIKQSVGLRGFRVTHFENQINLFNQTQIWTLKSKFDSSK